MPTQTVTVHLPEALYEQLKARAEQRQHSLADEVRDTLTAAVPVADDLPTDLDQAISPLAFLDDTALWRSAQSHFSAESAERLEALHQKRQNEGLTADEEQEMATLIRQYERIMLVRAQAALLLKQRGYDVASLLTSV
jgi:plasmid stability protein